MTAQELGLPDITPETAMLNLPSWCNPGFQLAVFQYTPTEITVPINKPTVIAVNNPRRWAIGFQIRIGAGDVIYVGTNQNTNFYGNLVTDKIKDNWYTLFVYGPMVQYEWLGFSGLGGTMLLHELELQ